MEQRRVPKVEYITQSGQQPLQPINDSSEQQIMPTQKDEDKMPLFLIKLWNIVEDPSYQNIIRWDESGYSFHIVDPYSFCRNVLPHYFKHNNLNSLIRQLNMYGFRKVSPLDKGGLTRSESDQDHLEFSHTCFIRGRPDLMANIKRRQSNRNGDNSSVVMQQTQGNLTVVMDELRQLREKQRNMDSKMSDLTKENEALWEQLDHVRQQHNRQQQIVNKLVQFLVAIVQPNMSKRVLKRGVLAIDEPPLKRARSTNSQSGNNVVDMLDRLQREIVEGGGLQQQRGYQNDRGPIIADVTDEVYTGSPTNRNMGEPHISSPGSSDQMGMYSANNIPNMPPQNIQYQQKPPCPNPPNSSVRYPAPPTNIPNKSFNNQAEGTQQIAPAYTPTLSMTPALERQISQELQDYLNGVDVNIDSCRDLLSGNWEFDFLDNLGDDNTDANQQGQPQLALQAAPHDNLDFLNVPHEIGANVDILDQSLNAQYAPVAGSPTCSTPTLLTPCTSPPYR